ncbi:MAG: hypothetical protein CFH44_00069 [Proteobacteria bacterium]|nr:MAG: hypothetical protein CFH44_00069 [Pseudomonadota bacterium]|tara:strand:- start:170 stop:472 length:303 start_codon:yes stop_codon:yes gene_type:complete
MEIMGYTITEWVAKAYLAAETLFTCVLVFMGIMTVIWTFRVMKDPAKQFDLAMDLFKNIFVWTWKGILFVWMSIVYLFNMIMRVFAVIFATIRDFFVSKN